MATQCMCPPPKHGPGPTTCSCGRCRVPAMCVDRVRVVLRSVDPGLALDEAGGLEKRIGGSVAPQRHWATLVGAFAMAALSLAAIGIFGMLSYLVTARRREIGVRVALGASRRGVIGMVVGRGMAYAIPGAVVGLLILVHR